MDSEELPVKAGHEKTGNLDEVMSDEMIS